MITYNLLSKVGGRQVNEDSVGMMEHDGVYCFLAADGLGGHGDGDKASELVTRVVMELFNNCGSMSEEFMKTAFQTAQNELLAEQKRLNKQESMKTTCAILITDGKNARWGHIGDTRIYRLWKSGRYNRTTDHSIPQMLAAMGQIKESQIRGHADRNRLFKVMGVEWDSPQYDISELFDLEEYNYFLLCTDGFWELIDESHMTGLLEQSADMKSWMNVMEKEVLKNGKNRNMDNYSAIAVRVVRTDFSEDEDVTIAIPNSASFPIPETKKQSSSVWKANYKMPEHVQIKESSTFSLPEEDSVKPILPKRIMEEPSLQPMPEGVIKPILPRQTGPMPSLPAEEGIQIFQSADIGGNDAFALSKEAEQELLQLVKQAEKSSGS